MSSCYQNRLHVSSRKQHRGIGQRVKCFGAKKVRIPMGSPQTLTANTGGVGWNPRFSTNISLYLRNGTIYRDSYYERLISNSYALYRMMLFPMTFSNPFCTFWVTFHVIVTGGDRHFKFGVRLTTASPSLRITNHSYKGHGQGHVTHFKFMGPKSYPCNGFAATPSKWYECASAVRICTSSSTYLQAMSAWSTKHERHIRPELKCRWNPARL